MKVTCSTIAVAVAIKSTVDAFQVPLGSKIVSPNPTEKTQSTLRSTVASSLSNSRRSLPFLSQIRSSSNENDEIEVGDEHNQSDEDGNGHNESIVDQLSLEEQKELILQQLSMVEEDENDADSDLSLEEQKELILQQLSMMDDDEDEDEFEMEEPANREEDVRTVSFNVEDVGYYNYYDEDISSQRMDQSNGFDDNYYGYDDVSEDLPPRERRRRRRQQEAASSLGATASDFAETAIRIGGKATNVAKKTTEKAWQRLVENTFDDEWDEEEYRPQSPQSRRRPSSNRPSRSTTRPMSRYERERRRTSSPMPKEQKDRYRPRRNPRRSSPGKPIEESINQFKSSNASSGIPSQPKRENAEISNQEDADSSDIKEEDPEYYNTDSSRSPEDPSWKSILEKTSKVASKKAKAIPRKIVNKAEKTAQRAKEVSYKAVSSLLEEEEEEANKNVDPVVMDAVIEDKTEGRIVEAEAIPMGDWPSNAWSNSQQPSKPPRRSETIRDASFERPPPRPRPRKRPETPSSSGPRRQRRPRPRRPQNPGRAMDDIDTSGTGTGGPDHQDKEQTYYYGLFQLPPAEGTMDQDPSIREKSTDRTSRRKVYSPYTSNRPRRNQSAYDYSEDEDDDMYTDGVDRMGNFVAEALDTFLWGREDGMDRPGASRRGRRSAAASSDGQTAKRHKRSGHWRDRMEEQFDEFLGIHEDGKYYDRWANDKSELEDLQERNRKKNGSGRDPVSFARGEVRRGKNRGRSRPIWEQEDSLLSVLFGTDHDTARRNARMYRSSSNLPFRGNGSSLLRVVQSLAHSLVLVAGRVSQWASVRGSVPQPVIVVGLMSALLSARPGKRWQTVLFATLGLRMLGELLHNYMYDDLDFEDDLSVVNHRDFRDDELGDDGFDVDDYDGADYL